MEKREYKNLGPRLSAPEIIERAIMERAHQQKPHGASEIVFFALLLAFAAAVILFGIFRY
jgi:hypothetical protein